MLHSGARASHCSGFSCCGAQALCVWASAVAVHRLSCMWDLPGAGLKLMSFALAGGFLITREVPQLFLDTHHKEKKNLNDVFSSGQPRLCFSVNTTFKS